MTIVELIIVSWSRTTAYRRPLLSNYHQKSLNNQMNQCYTVLSSAAGDVIWPLWFSINRVVLIDLAIGGQWLATWWPDYYIMLLPSVQAPSRTPSVWALQQPFSNRGIRPVRLGRKAFIASWMCVLYCLCGYGYRRNHWWKHLLSWIFLRPPEVFWCFSYRWVPTLQVQRYISKAVLSLVSSSHSWADILIEPSLKTFHFLPSWF